MTPQSTGESSKHVLDRASKSLQNNPTLILTLVNEAATEAPCAELKRAAKAALLVLQTIQTVKENKSAYVRLGDDSGGLIIAIWTSYKEAECPDEWLSADMRDILADITHTLQNIHSFVQDHISRNKAIRVIFTKADAVKIGEYREHLDYALKKFQLQPQRLTYEAAARKCDQFSENILHWNENDVRRSLDITSQEALDRELAEEIHAEELKKVKEISILDQQKQIQIDCRFRNERWHLEELKKIEKESNDRQSELERLRAAASAMERAKRLKNAAEELRRNNAAQLMSKVQAQYSKEKSRKRKDDVDLEEQWSLMVEEASEEEDSDVGRPVRRSSKEKRKPSKSSERRSMTFTGDDEQSVKSSKTKRARQTPSRTSIRAEETSDEDEESTDDEEDSRPRRQSRGKSPKVNRKSRSLSNSLLFDVDDGTSQIKGFSFLNGSHSESYLGIPVFPTYGPPFSPPPGSLYGYGVGLAGTIVNSGVGNISNTSISNVGNDNTVRKLYRSRTP
jgi:hypothetical protein